MPPFEKPEDEERAARMKAKAARRAATGQRLSEREQEESFWKAPAGQARKAKRSGQRWFQIRLGVSKPVLPFGWTFFDDPPPEPLGAMLTDIEDEGWSLFTADFVYEQTGGPSLQTTGETVGVYLFRATDAPARTDTPWLRP